MADTGMKDTKQFWKELCRLQAGLLSNPEYENVPFPIQYSDLALTRKTVAGMVYAFVKNVRKEPDAPYGRERELADIFECRTCVVAVSQVYLKGIMEAERSEYAGNGPVFHMDRLVDEQEAKEIMKRTVSPSYRTPPEALKDNSDKMKSSAEENESVNEALPEKISYEEVLFRLQKNEHALIVDVRTENEYAETHPKGAINLPLGVLLKNVKEKTAAFSKSSELYFFCKEGYQSEIAAGCFLQEGFSKVWYFSEDEYANQH